MFLTFEGIEGSGKSTQAARLAERLTRRGIPLILTREPGGTRIGTDIRRILLDASNGGLTPLAEFLLYEADRAQHVKEVIAPALAAGTWVLCDRFCDATVVYQGCGRGLDPGMVRKLNTIAASELVPDRTFLLDCPVSMGLARAKKRDRTLGEEDQGRFEAEAVAFHEKIRAGYLSLAREEPGRFVVLDGSARPEPLEAEILDALRPFLPGPS